MAYDHNLRYADQDAVKMYTTITEIGGIDSSHCILLKNPTRQDVLTEFRKLSKKVADLKKQGKASQVMAYYSGHGSSKALHISGEQIFIKDIIQWFDKMEANLKIFISDACRSGVMTELEVKGAKRVEPLERTEIAIYDTIDVSGSIILTSSSDKQESYISKDLQASFFTYYLISGMKGPADNSKDDIVSIMEAFNYVKKCIMNAGFTKKNKIQTPWYRINIKGTDDIIALSYIKKSQFRVTLKGLPFGMYRIRSKNGTNVADVIVDDPEEAIALQQGTYTVARQHNKKIYLAQLNLSKGGETLLTKSDFNTKRSKWWRTKDSESAEPLIQSLSQLHVQAVYMTNFLRIGENFPALELMSRHYYKYISFIATLGYLPIKKIKESEISITYSGYGLGGEARYAVPVNDFLGVFCGLKHQLWRVQQFIRGKSHSNRIESRTYDNYGSNTYLMLGADLLLGKYFSVSFTSGPGIHWNWSETNSVLPLGKLILQTEASTSLIGISPDNYLVIPVADLGKSCRPADYLLINIDTLKVYKYEMGFEKFYSNEGFGNPGFTDSRQSIDSSFLLCGGVINNSDIIPSVGWLVKTDKNGVQHWSKHFAGAGNGKFQAVYVAPEGSILLGGNTYATNSVPDAAWFLKTDSQGNEQWEVIFPGENDSMAKYFYDVAITQDGHYIACGSIYKNFPRNEPCDAWAVKLDKNGVELWKKTYPQKKGSNNFDCVLPLENGELLFIGNQLQGGIIKGQLIKTTAGGEEIWRKSLPSSRLFDAAFVPETNKQEILICGQSSELSVFIMKLDTNGNEIWKKTFDVMDGQEIPRAISANTEGNIIVAGGIKNHCMMGG